jgi:hypothetical protein
MRVKGHIVNKKTTLRRVCSRLSQKDATCILSLLKRQWGINAQVVPSETASVVDLREFGFIASAIVFKIGDEWKALVL